MSRAALVLLALALAGCADLPAAANREIAWQALNLIDAGQTVTIARQPTQWHEVNYVSVRIVGEHPSEGRALALMAGYAVAHAGIAYLLDCKDPGSGPWHVASVAWGYATLTEKGLTVANNYRLGIGAWEGRDHGN